MDREDLGYGAGRCQRVDREHAWMLTKYNKDMQTQKQGQVSMVDLGLISGFFWFFPNSDSH